MTEREVHFAEKLTELLQKAKTKKNVLNYSEIGDNFKGMEFTAEDAEKVLDFLEANGVDVLRMEDTVRDDEVLLLSDDDEASIEDDADAEIDVEKIDLSVPEGVSIEDPVRMYLKEIGKVAPSRDLPRPICALSSPLPRDMSGAACCSST